MIKNTHAVDITADLLLGDVSVISNIEGQSGGDNKYNMIPTGVMITKNSASDEVQPLVCQLLGNMRTVTLYLKINEIYELPVIKIFQTNSSTDSIILFGINN